MKVLYQFTKKNLMQNKNRTIVAIIGVTLTCILMFSLGIGASTLRESMKHSIKVETGIYHVKYDELPFKDYEKIKQNHNVETIEYEKVVVNTTIKKEKREREIELIDRNNYTLNYFELLEGKYPTTETELLISNSLSQMMGKQVGEKLILDNQNYTIVGIINGDNYYSNNGVKETVYINSGSIKADDTVNFYVTLKNLGGSLDNIFELSNELGLKSDVVGGKLVHEHETINEALLELNGVVRSYGKLAILILCLMLLLTVLGIASIIVIYNSFAISVTERKKMLGILSSIGATRWQLFLSVMIEATIIAIIAIPIGFLLSLGMMQLLLMFINYVMRDINFYQYTFSIYPLFLGMPLVFIIITIYLSAFFPAMRVFEMTPMEAIQLTTDIKCNKRSLKGGFLIGKIFGFESKIAYKNSKRNKKKYRITILSLFISIVLFITFSSFFNTYLKDATGDQELNKHRNIEMRAVGKKEQIESFYNDLVKGCKIKSRKYYQPVIGFYESDVTPQFAPTYEVTETPFGLATDIVVLENEDYHVYLKKLGYHKEKPIIINYAVLNEYGNEDNPNEITKQISSKIFENLKDLNFQLSIYMREFSLQNRKTIPFTNITDFYETKILPDGYETYSSKVQIIISADMYQAYLKESAFDFKNYSPIYFIELDTKNYYKIEKNMEKIVSKYSDLYIEYYNEPYEIYLVRQHIFLYRFLLYFVIGFILMIAITSVFNTIYTSMQLRKNEFAMLRSIGMTPKGFRKMIFFESLLFGIKSLVYGISFSLFIIWLFYKIQNIIPNNPNPKMPFPTNYIIVTVIVIMIVVFASMFYATRNLKKDNIVDVLKENSF